MATAKTIDQQVLQRIADAVPALVALYSIKTGEYLYVNAAAKRLLGVEPEEFISGGLEFAVGLVHPADITPLLEKNQQALETANQKTAKDSEPIVSFEYRMKHKDGGWRWVRTEGTVFSRVNGQVDQILNVTLDITEQHQTEERLKASLKSLETILK
jgi:PAS domain S-box-containing protein